MFPGEGGDDAVPSEVHEGSALVREGELRGGGLVRLEGDNLGIDVLHRYGGITLDVVRADAEPEGSDAPAGGCGVHSGAEREGRGDEPGCE